MNLILLEPDDFISDKRVCLQDRRLQHVLNVHRVQPGESLRVGLVNGKIGRGLVVQLSAEKLELEVDLMQAPPAPLDIQLLLALPRPKMLRRILQTSSALGIKQVFLINSYRVEKSFWGSPQLQEEKLREQLLLGLEQSCDTLLPKVTLRPRFKPFVEDELPELISGSRALVAHPLAAQPCPVAPAGPITLAIGPEGGFIPYEVEKLQQAGFAPISLGRRILRVETAVPVLLSRLTPT